MIDQADCPHVGLSAISALSSGSVFPRKTLMSRELRSCHEVVMKSTCRLQHTADSSATNVEFQAGFCQSRQTFNDLVIRIAQNKRLCDDDVIDIVGLCFGAKPNEIRVFAFITLWDGTGHGYSFYSALQDFRNVCHDWIRESNGFVAEFFF